MGAYSACARRAQRQYFRHGTDAADAPAHPAEKAHEATPKTVTDDQRQKPGGGSRLPIPRIRSGSALQSVGRVALEQDVLHARFDRGFDSLVGQDVELVGPDCLEYEVGDLLG